MLTKLEHCFNNLNAVIIIVINIIVNFAAGNNGMWFKEGVRFVFRECVTVKYTNYEHRDMD